MSDILAAYDQGYEEGQRKVQFNLADKPYMMYWCSVCECESAPEPQPIDYSRGPSLLIGHCRKCGAYLSIVQVSGRELLEMRLGTWKRHREQ